MFIASGHFVLLFWTITSHLNSTFLMGTKLLSLKCDSTAPDPLHTYRMRIQTQQMRGSFFSHYHFSFTFSPLSLSFPLVLSRSLSEVKENPIS